MQEMVQACRGLAQGEGVGDILAWGQATELGAVFSPAVLRLFRL